VFSLVCRVGRLVEVRVESLETVEEVAQVEERFSEVVSAVRAQVIVCGDYRNLRLFAPAVADRFMAVMAGSNERVERSAVLLPRAGGTASLQISRIVRETRYRSRRAFRELAPLEGWLGQVLDETERARLGEFLRAAP